MPQDLLTPKEPGAPRSREETGLHALLPKPKQWSEHHLGIGGALEEEGIFQSLWEGIRDTFFPKKLPPLVLTSKPVPVPDRMKVKRSPATTALSVLVHVLIILLIGLAIAHKIIQIRQNQKLVANLDLTPIAPLAAKPMGGGGGNYDKTPATQGKVPPPAKLNSPMIHPLIEQPKIPEPPSVDIPKNAMLPNLNLPNFGDPNGLKVNGPGSYGMGGGGGIGNGSGNGLGNGTGGGYGGGAYQAGGGVLPPQGLYTPEAEFSDEARRAKFQGSVTVQCIVDAQGHVQNPRVIHDPGMGLGEKALETVKTWRFKPGTLNGKPVAVWITAEVDFTIY